MQNRTVAVWLGLGAWVVGLAVVGAATAQAATDPDELAFRNVPNVFGKGILLAFSGLDGKTSSTQPFVASTNGSVLALECHLPRDPVLRITVPRGVARWQMATNDLLVAKVKGDTWPMVVGFASANVIVGRLPAGARVGLDGGDGTVQLLRRAAGDRTVFALAYDPNGARAAAEAATAGLRVAIDALVEARLDFFADAPTAPEGTGPGLALALAKAMSVMKANLYSPDPPISVRWPTPSRWPTQYMRLWDSAFQSLGLMHLDPKLAKEALAAVYLSQSEDGSISAQMGPGQTSEISQPPILGWAALQVYSREKTPDRGFLKASFDAAQKHVTWFMKQRRLDGEPPPTKPLEHGTPLYMWQSAEESGAENSPRFEDGAEFAAVDLSCYMVNECRMLQRMAQILGYRELAKTWGVRADAITAAARKLLWNEEKGFYFDRKIDGEWLPSWTYAGLLPMWSGIATPQQAARIKEHLVGRKFWSDAGVTTVARDDPGFKKDMWRGPTWVQINYLVIGGLRRYGYQREADDLAGKTLGTVAKWYARTGTFYEFYDPDDQTPPAALDRKDRLTAGTGLPVIPDYNVTAALYADLLLRPKP